MPRYKKFSPKKKSVEPVVFELMEERFTCVSNIPAGVLIKLSNFQTSDGTDDQSPNTNLLQQVVDFIESVMVDGDIPRFRTILNSKDLEVPFDELVEIMNWLIEEYSDRPTKQPSSSEDGPQLTGNGLTDNSQLPLGLDTPTG